MALSTPDAKQLRARNRQWLMAMAEAKQSQGRLHWRNAVVVHNLALVRQVANRLNYRGAHCFEELVSAGTMGLIRAVEAFDLKRDGSLSSFAVPYIRGAMLHDLRDHQQPLKTPRRLRELHQRAKRLLEQQHQQGLAPRSLEALATALGCQVHQLEAAEAVQRALQVRSLDAPLVSEEGEAWCLLDHLPAPAEDDDAATSSDHPRQRWLQRQLAAMACSDRSLLEDHWLGGLGWNQLGLKHRLSPLEARRRGEALLAQLQALAQAQTQAQGHGQQGGDQRLQAIDQFVAEPGQARLQGGANPALDQGGAQAHQGHQHHSRPAGQQSQGGHQQGHGHAAQPTGCRALQADRPLGAGWHGAQAGDQHGVATPAFADLATEGVRQFGGKAGGEAHQQQGLTRRRQQLGRQGQPSPGGR